MGLSLRDKVDLDKIKEIIEKNLDELTPQLGKILKKLNEDYMAAVNYARSFLDLTVITNSYKEILREFIDALYKHGVFAKFLNLDMGSGKTHLLTLIVYMLYAYEDLREKIGQLLRESGLDEEIKKLEEITRGTAVLAVDMRTPSEIMIYLPLFAKSLERVGEEDAARYVEESVNKNRFPEPSELVNKLRRGTRIVIIIDELHHALLTYSPVEGGVTMNWKDWGYVVGFIQFVIGLINYLRGSNRGFAILVASARSDVERVNMLNPSRIMEVKVDIDNLLDQLGRIHSISGDVSWLSSKEAKEIILKRIGAKNDIFHELFDEFISRVIKADTDIPQAQHMRSLIKAMAIFTKNAINEGHPVVSPAAFSPVISEESPEAFGGIIDALFPSGSDPTAVTYKTNYKQTIDRIDKIASNSEIRNATKYAVNAIFTMSISGRPEQIINMVRTYMSGTQPSPGIPYILESQLTKLLRDLGFKDENIHEVLNILSKLRFIHSVKIGEERAYFAIPYPSIVSLLNEMFESKYSNYVGGGIEWGISELTKLLYINFGSESEYALAYSLDDMEKYTKGLGSEGIRIIIIMDKEVIKRVSECQPSLECIDNVFKTQYGKRLSDWLKEQNKPHQLAVIVPRVTNDVIKGLAKYNATLDAIEYIVSNYLLEDKGKDLSNDIMFKLRELELKDIHDAMADRTEDALRSVVSALFEAISNVIMYRCRDYTNCSVELVPVHGGSEGVSGSEIRGMLNSRSYVSLREHYVSLREQIEKSEKRNMSVAAKKIHDQIKMQLGFVDDKNLALNAVLESIASRLPETKIVEVHEDQNVWIFRDQVIYVPPSTMRDVIKALTPERIKSLLKNKAEVEVTHEDSKAVIKLKEPITEPTPPPSLSLQSKTKDPLEITIERMRSLRRGRVIIELKFDEAGKERLIDNLRYYVRAFKDYLGDIKVEGE